MKINACAKTYGGRTVLRFPGLDLTPGRIYAVAGANGSGKSTFARLVSGAIRADGNSRVLEAAGQVGYMPQRSCAFRLTVRRNILLSGGKPERAEALMEALGIASLSGRRASGLSGGETARMALARVLMRPWALLVLDEPTASMRETGCTVLLITHDLQQARRLADEALFFYQGRLWEDGPAERVLFAPDRPETRRFLQFYGGESRPPGE